MGFSELRIIWPEGSTGDRRALQPRFLRSRPRGKDRAEHWVEAAISGPRMGPRERVRYRHSADLGSPRYARRPVILA